MVYFNRMEKFPHVLFIEIYTGAMSLMMRRTDGVDDSAHRSNPGLTKVRFSANQQSPSHGLIAAQKLFSPSFVTLPSDGVHQQHGNYSCNDASLRILYLRVHHRPSYSRKIPQHHTHHVSPRRHPTARPLLQ